MSTREARARALAGYRLAGGSATVPITNGMMSAGGQQFQPLGSTTEAPPLSVPFQTSAHNTHLHVGGILLGAGLFIIAWHLSGFRIAFDVGMGRG